MHTNSAATKGGGMTKLRRNERLVSPRLSPPPISLQTQKDPILDICKQNKQCTDSSQSYFLINLLLFGKLNKPDYA
ncbi:hypothetical protein A8990_12754 [Paenibacillus taihuensis]|uniref:Uncharacterized protein n=1 Tax=Paenibacillus taihuensis TaxID=1156355 RepID=A0A3D9RPW9_9BACL|nr:hypothetical protein A8990_12754 [Paenibacillus taihuensis]